MAKTTRNILLSITSFLLLSAFAFASPVPDTGQTKCYDDQGNEITCPQPGERFYGQDGNYTINPPCYTKLDANGNDLPDSAASWVMVRDNVTGLIWEVKQNKDGQIDYSNPNDADNKYTWYDSNPESNGGDAGMPGDGTDTEDLINALNSANFGGFSDWRLPDREELRSIINYGRYMPATDTNYFPNTMTMTSYYLSSTTCAGYTSNAWLVYFGSGYDIDYYKSSSYYVRAVRSGQPRSFDNLAINGDGTVTDTATGLMWQQETAGAMDWEAALSYCENLSLAGYSDWRLPTIKELASIVDLSRFRTAIDTYYFPNTVSSYYWSSTTYAYYLNYLHAWLVSFCYGGYGASHSKSSSYYVRAVRSGQSGSLDNLVISDISSPQSVKVPFEATITARNKSGGLVTGFSGNVALSSFVPLSPRRVYLSNGTWTGNVILYEGGSNISLVVSGLGISGTSNLFSTEPLKGDLDADGDVDVTDAVLGLQILAGVASKNVKITADLSSDGKIGMEEVIYILQRVSELRQESIPQHLVITK